MKIIYCMTERLLVVLRTWQLAVHWIFQENYYFCFSAICYVWSKKTLQYWWCTISNTWLFIDGKKANEKPSVKNPNLQWKPFFHSRIYGSLWGKLLENYRWSNKLAIKRVISDAAKDQEFFSLCRAIFVLSVHRLVRGWGQLSAALPELLGIQCLF